MTRFFFTIAFCISLLLSLSFFLFPASQAAENPLLTLLDLPAPPPPNPLVRSQISNRPEDFFSKGKVPPDDAPIQDLVDYWRQQNSNYRELGYNPKPSDKVFERLIEEVKKNPESVYRYLNVFREYPKAAELVKEIYDRSPIVADSDRNLRTTLRRWLKYNSPHFSMELAREASQVQDANEYVTKQEELLSLGRVDWERARGIVDRLYAGNQKVSRVLAQWALYRHALDEGSLSDIERYRDELKAVVEDKTATPGMRDLAFDALVKEKEWEGRDEWYYSLLSDETLGELRVNGTTYTGLTTIMYYTADDRYVEKMIELVKSDNKTVRTAAAKNLLHRLNTKNPEVVRALLPWLENPNWVSSGGEGRAQIVVALREVKMPESVLPLIAALNEKEEIQTSYDIEDYDGPVYASNANRAVANAMRAATNAMRAAADAASRAANMPANSPGIARKGPPTYIYPLRYSAIGALANQRDARAVPALRRLLTEAQPHEQHEIIGALFRCGGFTIAEQVDALEYVARVAMPTWGSGNANSANAYYPSNVRSSAFDESDMRFRLGMYIAALYDVKDEPLIRAVIDRIVALDRSDPQTASMLRKAIVKWEGAAVNALFLRDLKNNRTGSDAILRLLILRKELREKQQSDVYDLRTGSPTAVGISSCILESAPDYEAILNGPNSEAKTAMLACARLIRAPLSVEKVAAELNSKDKLLALAAERYLISEDSPAARRIVLSLHPNEAMILGATTAFTTSQTSTGPYSSSFLAALFSTVVPDSMTAALYYYGGTSRNEMAPIEERLQKEVKESSDLLGVYNWKENFIRIYKDRAVVSWEQDPARFRERVLTPEEFDGFKGLLAHYKADEQPPYLACGISECKTAQLLMLGRNGGRRVFVQAAAFPPMFAEMDRMFEDMRRQPSTIKYWASKDVPGLEVLFADDKLDAIAVWKNGADFRLLIADKVRREEIDRELAAKSEELSDDDAYSGDENEEALEEAVSKEREKREYENFSWSTFANGALSGAATQPAEVEYIPLKDGFEPKSGDEQWKARAGGIEIRASGEGLYKLAGGKITKLKAGDYSNPVMTSNGRWVIVTKSSDEEGSSLVRVNLLTNREFPIDMGERYANQAFAWVPSINRVIVGVDYEGYGYYHPMANRGSQYMFVDPDTGVATPVRGEVRPLAKQSYRPLQPAANPFEFWAAVADDDKTVVGIYNSRTLTLKPLLNLPQIKFESTDMWVDAPGGKVYFVYEGQLLGAPINVAR